MPVSPDRCPCYASGHGQGKTRDPAPVTRSRHAAAGPRPKWPEYSRATPHHRQTPPTRARSPSGGRIEPPLTTENACTKGPSVPSTSAWQACKRCPRCILREKRRRLPRAAADRNTPVSVYGITADAYLCLQQRPHEQGRAGMTLGRHCKPAAPPAPPALRKRPDTTRPKAVGPARPCVRPETGPLKSERPTPPRHSGIATW